jgi:hypothetical protein
LEAKEVLRMAIVSLLLASSLQAAVPGDWARYEFVLAKADAKPSVKEVTITIGSREGDLRWWEMAVTKLDGSSFVVRALSKYAPMSVGPVGQAGRYLFKDGDRPFLEYRDKSGGPMLPTFDFRTELIPCPATNTAFDGIFATSGTYLGNGVQLVETGHGKTMGDIGEPKVLVLDPTLIVGTGRNFRDIDEGRVTDRDYNYRPFTPEEYDEMEAAGTNFFIVDTSERELMVRERPAFYTKYPVFEDYPNILYRPNYRGTSMFTDEPAIINSFSDCRRVTDASNLLRTRVAASLAGDNHYSRRMLPILFEKAGVYLGTWNLLQQDMPAWEAVYSAGFHELEGGASSVIHEGRYDLNTFNAILKGTFGPEFEVTTEEMLDLHYAFLRGAARCFGGDWGTSIYGQADPAISPLAIKMAYDQGARYIWFWTSDHGHHMPYKEQLELTQVLREHEKAHPRRPMNARIAVAFPEGYIGWSEFWPNGLWNNERFGFQKTNEQGATYGSVVAVALKQGIALARKGIQFDFVVDGEPARKAGYDKIIRVGTDGSVD